MSSPPFRRKLAMWDRKLWKLGVGCSLLVSLLYLVMYLFMVQQRDPNGKSSIRLHGIANNRVSGDTSQFTLSNDALSVLMTLRDFNETLSASKDDANRFFFTWTTGWDTWNIRHTLFLDSLFMHHPNASVYFVAVISDAAIPPVILRYVAAGYKIRGVLATEYTMVRYGWFLTQSNKEWLQKAATKPADWPYLYSHLSDYLRFLLLYRYGGLYTDTDAVTLQPFPSTEFVGADINYARLEWFLDPDAGVYIAPGVMRVFSGTQMFKDILARVFCLSVYEPACFNCVGPKAITTAIKASEWQEKEEEQGQISDVENVNGLHSGVMLSNTSNDNCSTAGLALLPGRAWTAETISPMSLYPISYEDIQLLFRGDVWQLQWEYLEHLRRTSLSVHLFGKTSANMVVQKSSVVDELFRSISLNTPSSVCAFRGNNVQVMVGDAMRFVNQHIVYITTCVADITSTNTWKLVLTAVHGLFMGNESVKRSKKVEIAGVGAKSTATMNSFIQSVTYLASDNENITQDRVTFAFFIADRVAAEFVVTIVHFSRSVTVVTLSSSSEQAKSSHDSLQTVYPGTQMLAAVFGKKEMRTVMSNSTLNIVQLTSDTSHTAAWKSLFKQVTTPYLYVLAEGGLFVEKSHLDVLFSVLYSSKADVVGHRIETDNITDNVEEQTTALQGGHINFVNDTLVLELSNSKLYRGCMYVQYLPKAFLMSQKFSNSKQGAEITLEMRYHWFFHDAYTKDADVLYCDNISVDLHAAVAEVFDDGSLKQLEKRYHPPKRAGAKT